VESANGIIESVVTLVSTWGLKAVGAVAVLILGRWIASGIRKASGRALSRAGVDETLAPFLTGMAYYLVLAVVVIAVLNLFGIETTSLVAVVGAAGLAIGLALQGTLSNFAAGVMLLLFRPFKTGDFIVAGGSTGTVAEVGMFTTTLNTPDNVKIIVPNSDVAGGTIMNYSAYDRRRNDLTIGISYDDDIGKAISVIQQILGADSRVHDDPAPVIAVAELGDSSVNLVVRPWCNASDYWNLRFDLQRKIKEDLETAGCSIPYPQHDVHVVATNGSGATVA
jgi:small conductance mechanosensitive channel